MSRVLDCRRNCLVGILVSLSDHRGLTGMHRRSPRFEAASFQRANVETGFDPGLSDYERLLDQYGQPAGLTEGEVLKGRVLKVTGDGVVVDVGYKSEGMIPIQEFIDSAGSLTVRPGDEIDVLLEFTENREGHIVLSREKAERIKAWDEIERAFHDQRIVTGVVVERVKGGLSVDIGMKAFLPGSQVGVRPVKNLDSYRGQKVQCRIIKINGSRGNIVLSRKVVLEEQTKDRRYSVLGRLEEGLIVGGVVKNITDYGVFVDLGGIDGLLHVTDIFWGRVRHPSNVFTLGSEIQVKVLQFDRKRERVSLGYKQLSPDPWESVSQRYPVGARVKGKVIGLTDYGAFLEVEEGVEGWVHVSEISWNKRIKRPSRLLALGDTVGAVVLEVHPQERRLSLGLKQAEPDPWATLTERYQIGTLVTGKVRNLTEFGAFIEIEDGIDGLLHVSDLSWTRKVKHPSEMLKKGEQLTAVILRLDTANHRLALGLKQLQPDVWKEFFSGHRLGDLVRGKVTHFVSFGAFVELEGGIEGLCHISQLESSGETVRPLLLDQSYDFRIVRLSPHEHKIGLSLETAPELTERPAVRFYTAAMSTQGSSTYGHTLDVAHPPEPEQKLSPDLGTKQ
jgi:small subunit ribosomal protein S1